MCYLQTIISRAIPFIKCCFVSHTHGGEGYTVLWEGDLMWYWSLLILIYQVSNVIPDTVELGGTVRPRPTRIWTNQNEVFKIGRWWIAYAHQANSTILTELNTTVNSTCYAYGCSADITFSSTYPVLANHEKVTISYLKTLRRCSPLSISIIGNGSC